MDVVSLPVSKLVKDPMNMREDPQDVSDLVEEVKRHGWTVPLEVRPLKNGAYGVVCGSRRLHAARVMGLEEVPCIITPMNDEEALRRSIADNEAHRPLTEEERVAYYKMMISIAGGFRAASRKFKIPKETMRDLLLRHELQDLVESDEDEGGLEVKPGGGGGTGSGGAPANGEKSNGKKVKLSKKARLGIAKEMLKKAAGGDKPFWKLDKDFLQSLKKDIVEKVESIESKVWSPKIFKRKSDMPALHEVLQKPTVLEVVPTEPWPIGWKPVTLESHGMKMLIPSYELGGDFTSVAVLLCPSCGTVLRGLGKGLPVVCLDCGFPSNLYGWKADGG